MVTVSEKSSGPLRVPLSSESAGCHLEEQDYEWTENCGVEEG
jgi:hypothetical protein